ncbi:N-acyl-L-amino acid amidohydrolase [Comamonas serinivorans]|uniref:N-acyl-L-amino acid amidohydrolase n=1 Tax=Comamonas serinivorans TaxID=1082851 RepID=A0A1Y0EMY4_9BURK|nr:amidohydrolase [Comamonas serinivorans]ARU04946.1 N-acyl-L-amino acid amidohydrolase [Comamonas serinivorans]
MTRLPHALSFSLSPVMLAAALALTPGLASAQALSPEQIQQLGQRAQAVQPKMVAWRRDIHQHPELSGQEVRTAKLVADHLRALGLEVRTGVGGTGVVGLLRGGKPGKVVALRADMDALPVLEQTGLPFASKVTAKNFGKDSPVMHACGHDGHTAILMGVAEVLAGMKAEIPGTVKFIFQPAEEGRSEDPKHEHETFGAKAMIADGVLDNPKVDAIFGLHLAPRPALGAIGYRIGSMMAGADGFKINVTGKQTHGSQPWSGIDPIAASAQIVSGLQTVVSRQLDITKAPAVVTIGAINGGNRENIIPDKVEMLGTLRTFNQDMRTDAKQRIAHMVSTIASASGATAQVTFSNVAYPPTENPAELSGHAVPVLQAVTGGKAEVIPLVSGSEDFSDFQLKVPGFFFILGAPPKDRTPAPNHSPLFDFDEAAMPTGAQALSALALDQLTRLASAR